MTFIDQLLVTTYLKTRDEMTFRMLYSRHAKPVWNMAMKLTNGDRDQSEEITQDTWMRALQGLSAFEWRSSLRTWLVKIVINRWMENKRKKKLVMLEANHLSTNQQPLTIEIQDMYDIIALLPEGYKTVLLLHDLEGYKHEEIAAMLDIAPGTSKSQLHQARKAFRNLIQKTHI